MKNSALHIANNAQVLELLSAANIPGDGISWDDPLYAGPLLPVSLEELTRKRVDYLVSAGLADRDSAKSRYKNRDAVLRRFRHYDEVTLWFDHDLCDQLQMLQLFNWFSQQTAGKTRLTLVCISFYPGVFNFTGLQSLHHTQIARLFAQRSEISTAQMELARICWAALCSSDPLNVQSLFATNLSILPFIKDALIRFMDEYPGNVNGLSRTQMQILVALKNNALPLKHIFTLSQRREDRPFIDERYFIYTLAQLCRSRYPLVLPADSSISLRNMTRYRFEEIQNSVFDLTSYGRDMVEEKRDQVQLNGIDTWIGGVHLEDGNIWRRNVKDRKLKRTYA